jgi:hypothetical protein
MCKVKTHLIKELHWSVKLAQLRGSDETPLVTLGWFEVPAHWFALPPNDQI